MRRTQRAVGFRSRRFIRSLADNNGSGNLKLEPFSWELLADRGVKVLFLATPHEQSREWVPEALSSKDCGSLT